jgi:hypothetical protein
MSVNGREVRITAGVTKAMKAEARISAGAMKAMKAEAVVKSEG